MTRTTTMTFYGLIFFSLSLHLATAQAKTQIILDADTANEVDDLYAVVRAFAEPSWNVQALNATQWQASQWATDQTMEDSHRLNLVLAAYLKPENTELLRGGYRRMYDWGDKAQHSAAAYNIIEQAQQQPEGEKLTIIALGALTNVASALFIEPEIADNIKLYWLGSTFDFEEKQSGHTDFNPMMDIQAFEYLMSSQVEIHIMPVSEVDQMKSNYLETKERLENVHPLGEFLVQRWFNHMGPGREERVLWDLAIIEVMLHPEWATEVKADVFENPNVFFYKDIDGDKILEDSFNSIISHLKSLK